MDTRGIESTYGALLGLFPREFQTEFREEMQAVFHSLAMEAARSGELPLLRLCFFELLDLPINLIDEHVSRLRKERSMKKLPLGTRPFRSAQLGGVGFMIGFMLLMVGQKYLLPCWQAGVWAGSGGKQG